MTALYSKYRPRIFDDVVGQEHVTKTLKESLKSGNLSHAYILSGTRGTGKTTIARLIAASANCNGNLTCGKCDDCISIADGTHPDVIEIDAASNRGIADIKEIKDRVRYFPVKGKYKVYILDEVHMLTTEASNALLKTLEEPPRHAIFILATTDLNKVLLTIRSRCQSYVFRLVRPSDILKRLKQINILEDLSVPDATLQFISEEAKGSVRDAISLLDVVSRLESKDVDRVRYLTGRLEFSRVGDFIECLCERDSRKAINFINKVYSEENVDMALLREDVIVWLRFLTHIVAGAKFEHPMLQRMQRQASDFNLSDLSICIKEFTNVENYSSVIIPQLTMELPALSAIVNMSPAQDF